MMVHMRKYAKKLGVLLLAFFVSNFLILNLADLDGFLQRAKAASNEWAWSKGTATSFCQASSETPSSPGAKSPVCTEFRKNYRGTGPLKDYGDQAFKDAGVQNADPKLYVSKLSWALDDKVLFCQANNNSVYANASPDFPNSSNQCIEVNQAAANAKSIPYKINEDLKKQLGTSGNTDPVPCEYEDREITIKLDQEEKTVNVRVPKEGAKTFPIQQKYEELLAKSKDKSSYDWSTFDLSTTGFTKEEAASCMEETMAASQQLYNAAFQAVVLAAKLLLSPGPEILKDDGNPANPFYEKLGGKVYLGSRLISWEEFKSDITSAAVTGVQVGLLAAAVIVIGAIILAFFTGGVSLYALGFAIGASAGVAGTAFVVGASLGAAASLFSSYYNNKIKLSGANVYNTYTTSIKPLSSAFWMMAQSSMLLATTKGKADPLKEDLLPSSKKKDVLFAAANDVIDIEATHDQLFSTTTISSVNQVLALGKNAAPFLNGEVAKKMNALSGRLQSADRCGNEQSPGFLTANGFMQIICVVAVATQEFSEYILSSSLNMLAQTAGFASRVPSTDSGSDNLFDFLVPVEIRTPPESIIGSSTNDVGRIISKTHSLILTLVNFILLLFFIFIALSNILQIQVSTYQISKMFPQLVIGLILANASIFVIRGVMEAVSYVTEFFALGGYDINQLAQNLSNIGGADKVTFFYDQATGLVKSGLVMKQATLNLFVIAAAVVVFILAFLFVVRSIIFYFLTPLSALAFFSAAVKPIGFIWKQWSKNFFNWLFMPLIASFWLWLAFQFFTATSSTSQSAFGTVLGYLFGMVCMVTAIKSSVGSLSGEAKMVMDKWQGMGKKAWGATGGAGLKATGKWAGRGLKTFAYNKNIAGIPGLLERNKQREAILEKRLENAKNRLGARDTKYNRRRAVLMARETTQADIIAGKKKKMETQAKMEDDTYRQLQRGLGKLNSYQEELDGLMKKRIKLEKSYIDETPAFLKRAKKTAALKHAADDYNRLKADSMVLNEKIADKELNDFNDFENFIDGKDEKGNVVNEKYLAGVKRDAKGNVVRNADGTVAGFTGNKVRAAINREAALKKQVEKKDEENRMGEAARFNRASSLMSRSKYYINKTAKAGQGMAGKDADELREWLGHAANYYEGGVHAEYGQAYKEVLSSLGTGDISAEQMEAANSAIAEIGKSKKFESAREIELGLAKRVGQMEGEYLDKKAADINRENDIDALKKLDSAEDFAAVITGNTHRLDPGTATKVERATVAVAKDLSGNQYNRRRVEQAAKQAANLRNTDLETVAEDKRAMVQEAQEKLRFADEKLRAHLKEQVRKVKSRDNGRGKPKENEVQFYDAFGGIDKLEADADSMTVEKYQSAMAKADTKAKAQFAANWRDSKAAEHIGMGERTLGMPGDVRKGGAGENVDEHPPY